MKTIHQEVAEYLEGRAKELDEEARSLTHVGENALGKVANAIADEFRLLSEHIHGLVGKRGMT